MAWNQRADMVDKFRLAIGSFVEEYSNKVQVLMAALIQGSQSCQVSMRGGHSDFPNSANAGMVLLVLTDCRTQRGDGWFPKGRGV